MLKNVMALSFRTRRVVRVYFAHPHRTVPAVLNLSLSLSCRRFFVVHVTLRNEWVDIMKSGSSVELYKSIGDFQELVKGIIHNIIT